MPYASDRVKIFSGSASRDLAETIAKHYGSDLGKSKTIHFADGEFSPAYEETVRGAYVLIVQSTFPPTENLMELLLLIDAARRASADQVVAVIPYFGFARQDRKDRPRVSIASKLVANLLMAAGVSRIMTMDLHADQIQGFFDIPVDHLYASSIFIPYIKKLNLENLVIAAPDTGGSKRANAYSKYLNCELAICHKFRKRHNVVEKITVIGDVKDKNVVLVDDIIDTAGSISMAANIMMEQGARSVRVFATHAVLSQKAYENIQQSALAEAVVTDTIPLRKFSEKIKVLSCAELFANVIKKVYKHESISSEFIF